MKMILECVVRRTLKWRVSCPEGPEPKPGSWRDPGGCIGQVCAGGAPPLSPCWYLAYRCPYSPVKTSPTGGCPHLSSTPSWGFHALTHVAQGPAWRKSGELGSWSHAVLWPGSPSSPHCSGKSLNQGHLMWNREDESNGVVGDRD